MELLRPLTVWGTAAVLVASLAVGGALEWRAHQNAATRVVPTGLPASLTSPGTAPDTAVSAVRPSVEGAPPVPGAPGAEVPRSVPTVRPAPGASPVRPGAVAHPATGPDRDPGDDPDGDDPDGDSGGDSDDDSDDRGDRDHADRPGYPPDRQEARRRLADALCDRYHLPRERCEQAARNGG